MNRPGDRIRRVESAACLPGPRVCVACALAVFARAAGRLARQRAGRPILRPVLWLVRQLARWPALQLPREPGPRRDERGSGTVYALGVIAVLLAAAVGIAGLIQAQTATGRARAAADLSAVSGATVLSSVIAPGDPCAMAGRVAAANGASMSACSVAGKDVTVSVVVPTTILGLPRQATAQARAGPVDAPPGP